MKGLDVRRWTVPLVFAVAASASAARTAEAGEWSIRVEFSKLAHSNGVVVQSSSGNAYPQNSVSYAEAGASAQSIPDNMGSGLYSGNTSRAELTAKAVATWTPESYWDYDPETEEEILVIENDPPPSFVSMRECAKAMVAFSERDVIDGQVRGGVDYEVSNGVGDSPVVEWQTLIPHFTQTYEGIAAYCNKNNKWRLRTLPTSGDGATSLPNGVVEVKFPIRSLSGMMKGFEGNGSHSDTRVATVGLSYGAEVDNRLVSISSDLETKYKFPQPYLAENTREEKKYLGFLKRHYTLTEIGQPLEYFIGGIARYELTAKKSDNTDIFNSQTYTWTTSGSHQNIYVDPAVSGDTWKEQDITQSHPRKHLHLDFGDDWADVDATDGFATTVVEAEASGTGSDLMPVKGKVTVNWFSPKLLNLPSNQPPDWDPADQTIEDYILAKRQTIQQGAQLTSAAFGLYAMAAESLMPDPTMGVLKGLKFCGASLRAARNAGGVRGLVSILKSRLVKQVDYPSVHGARVLDDVPTASVIAQKMQNRNVKALAATDYVGAAPSPAMVGDIKDLVDGDVVSASRIENLYQDAATTTVRDGEVAQALCIEKKNDITLRRITPTDETAGKGGDFIDTSSGTTYDPVGRYDDDNFDNSFFSVETHFAPAFKKHLEKPGLDVVVVDTTGLTPTQAQEVLDFVNSYPNMAGKTIEYLPLPAQ
jgi:hypothetical protein